MGLAMFRQHYQSLTVNAYLEVDKSEEDAEAEGVVHACGAEEGGHVDGCCLLGLLLRVAVGKILGEVGVCGGVGAGWSRTGRRSK